jgi:hypothetical protein
MGPCLVLPQHTGGATLPPGNQVIYDLLTGHYAALVDLNWAVTDVRDCAQAHVLAMEYPNASGRYVCVNRTVWLKELVQILYDNGYSGRDLPFQLGLPHWVARLPAYAAQLGQVGASLYGEPPKEERACHSPYLSDRLCHDLGRSVFTRSHETRFAFRHVKETVLETAADLLAWKWIKPWAEDRESVACAICHVSFTFLRRRHHCRVRCRFVFYGRSSVLSCQENVYTYMYGQDSIEHTGTLVCFEKICVLCRCRRFCISI